MRICPEIWLPAELDPQGFVVSPVLLPPYLHAQPRSKYDVINASLRPGFNPNYRWRDDDALCGHKGPDLGSRLGNPLFCPAKGSVASVDLIDGYNKQTEMGDAAGVWLSTLARCPECGGWFLFRVLHLTPGSVLVKAGDPVAQGQILAKTGWSGSAHWPHTHLDMRHSSDPKANQVPPSLTRSQWFGPKWGKPFDPLAYGILGAPALPPSAPLPTVDITITRPVLRNGDAGLAVQDLQSLLVNRKAVLNVDGKFGSLTESAVKDFQRAKGLTVDGIVGRQSWSALLDF